MYRKLIPLLKTQTAKDTMVTTVATGGGALLAAVFFILAARLLGPENFGIFSLATALSFMLADIFDIALNSALVHICRSAFNDRLWEGNASNPFPHRSGNGSSAVVHLQPCAPSGTQGVCESRDRYGSSSFASDARDLGPPPLLKPRDSIRTCGVLLRHPAGNHSPSLYGADGLSQNKR